MGFLDKLKKSVELKQNVPNQGSINKAQEKISQLEKKLESSPDNSKLLLNLYGCYVEVSDTAKKIECLEKLTKLNPKDAYPFQQLADIYLNEVDDVEKATEYQNMANKINNY